MPAGEFTPSQLHIDYPEWAAPLIGNIGQVWAYTGSGYAPVALDFDPAGTAAAAVAAHVGLPNPHSQYYLASGVSGFGATLASAADAAAARTTLELGTAAVLNVGTGANNIVQLDGSARLPAVDGSQLTGVTVAAAGSNTQVVYNASGVYAGHSGMTYSSANSRLTVAGGLVAPSMRPASDSTTALGWFDASGTQFVYGDTTNQRMGIGAVPNEKFQIYSTALRTEMLIGSKVSHTQLYAGYDTQTWASVEVASNELTQFILSGNISLTNYVVGFLVFANRYGRTEGTDDLRIAQITGRTDGATNSGALVFQTAAAGSLAERARITSSGYLAIGQSSATALLDLGAGTAARAPLRIRAGTAPTSPNAGDIYFNGTNFFGYNGSAWKQLDN